MRRRYSCPVGCPPAWSQAQGLTCTGASSGRFVPTNVSPWVRPAGCGCAWGRDECSSAGNDLRAICRASAGVVPSCPVAGQVAWRRPDVCLALHFPAVAAVPAKEGKKREQLERSRGGGA